MATRGSPVSTSDHRAKGRGGEAGAEDGRHEVQEVGQEPDRLGREPLRWGRDDCLLGERGADERDAGPGQRPNQRVLDVAAERHPAWREEVDASGPSGDRPGNGSRHLERCSELGEGLPAWLQVEYGASGQDCVEPLILGELGGLLLLDTQKRLQRLVFLGERRLRWHDYGTVGAAIRAALISSMLSPTVSI